MSEQRGQYMKPGTPPPPTTSEAAPETPAVGELTGLLLSKFATAEMVAKARAAGFPSLWSYVDFLESRVVQLEGLLQYERNRAGQ